MPSSYVRRFSSAILAAMGVFLIQILGGLLIVAIIGDQFFGALELFLLTQHNPFYVEPIQWRYDPTDFKMAALASVLFMFGWVMRDTIEVGQTNKEFV
jgi:hypothetical protein